MIYLNRGDIQKADYVADVLLDLGHEASDACLLKGRVLEAQDKKEDAFFYYDRACSNGSDDQGSREAAEERSRLLAVFEPGYVEYKPENTAKKENKRNG